MGGELALYLAAPQPSIARCVSAGFLSTFKGLLIYKPNCYSIRDWPRWFEIPDIAGAVAPRPLLVLKGEDDGCFHTPDVEAAAEKVGDVFTEAGAANRFSYNTFPGGHCLNVDMACEWLQRL